MRVSIHISTMDRAAECAVLLHSLLRQTFQDFDIVMVDGSSTPIIHHHLIQQLFAVLKNDGHKIIYDKADCAGENCKQRNQCVEIDDTHNPLICRVDDDCALSMNYLELLHDAIVVGKADASSGVTPTVTGSSWMRNKLPDPCNIIKFDAEGNIVELGDDCGMLYHAAGVSWAHHLRSSFMYKREVHDAGITYKTPGRVAFREETEFCLRMAWAGFNKFIVNTRAIAWHFQANSGGCRTADYAEQVRMGDERFRAWTKKKYQELGNPFEVKA